MQNEGTSHGARAYGAQQNSVEFWSAYDLIARDQRKQCPIGAGEYEKIHRARQCGAQMPIVPCIAEASDERVAEPLGWKNRASLSRRTPPAQCPDHSNVTDSVEPERRGYSNASR